MVGWLAHSGSELRTQLISNHYKQGKLVHCHLVQPLDHWLPTHTILIPIPFHFPFWSLAVFVKLK